MNQLCKVCGEPAAGYHFGAFTCEGCKSFFGRTYNNLTALGECKNNNACVINKKNRTSCKSCRLKKCLVVGMSKSGSRYGRRSNWFKIHCLIQDQQEMTNRLAEQGVLQSNGQIQRAFNENKDLLSQYKTTTDSFRETNSASSAHHVSPRAASPNSSEGSVGALSSPFSSLFDSTKGNGFATRFDTNSPSYVDSRKEMNHHFGIHTSGLPLSPVSPLSPMNPVTTARFLFHNSMVKGVNGLHAFPGMSKFYNADLGFAAYPSRLLSLHALNPVLKQSSKDPDLSQNIGECYADVPEQERPIDLSVKSTTALSEAALRKLSKSLKTCVGDRDSGFSPSSNEENNNNNNNNNSSPLDLTAKRTPDPPIDEPNDEHSDSDEDEHNSPLESSKDK